MPGPRRRRKLLREGRQRARRNVGTSRKLKMPCDLFRKKTNPALGKVERISVRRANREDALRYATKRSKARQLYGKSRRKYLSPRRRRELLREGGPRARRNGGTPRKLKMPCDLFRKKRIRHVAQRIEASQQKERVQKNLSCAGGWLHKGVQGSECARGKAETRIDGDVAVRSGAVLPRRGGSPHDRVRPRP